MCVQSVEKIHIPVRSLPHGAGDQIGWSQIRRAFGNPQAPGRRGRRGRDNAQEVRKAGSLSRSQLFTTDRSSTSKYDSLTICRPAYGRSIMKNRYLSRDFERDGTSEVIKLSSNSAMGIPARYVTYALIAPRSFARQPGFSNRPSSTNRNPNASERGSRLTRDGCCECCDRCA